MALTTKLYVLLVCKQDVAAPAAGHCSPSRYRSAAELAATFAAKTSPGLLTTLEFEIQIGTTLCHASRLIWIGSRT